MRIFWNSKLNNSRARIPFFLINFYRHNPYTCKKNETFTRNECSNHWRVAPVIILRCPWTPEKSRYLFVSQRLIPGIIFLMLTALKMVLFLINIILIMITCFILVNIAMSKMVPNPTACYADCFVKFRPDSCGDTNPDPYGCLCKDVKGVQGCISTYSQRNNASDIVKESCKEQIGHSCGDDLRFIGE